MPIILLAVAAAVVALLRQLLFNPPPPGAFPTTSAPSTIPMDQKEAQPLAKLRELFREQYMHAELQLNEFLYV